MKSKFFFTSLTLILLYPSCGKKIFYQKNDTITNEVWNIDSLLHYQFEIFDSIQFYNFYVDVRNTVDYPFQDFHIFFTTTFPNGFLATDTLSCILSDPFGKWKGKGSGRIKENRFLFKPKVRFQQKGIYHFAVQQAMREDNLKGIASFGITVEYFSNAK